MEAQVFPSPINFEAMKKLKWIYIIVLIVITSCTKDELNYELSSSSEVNSGVELFDVDSISYNAGNHQVYFHFRIKTELFASPSDVRNVAVYRDGSIHINLPPSQLDHYLDTGVPDGFIFQYQFALWNTDGELSKLSQVYEIDTH
jgi:hypothetical protein